MQSSKTLSGLIEALQKNIQANTLTEQIVDEATKMLVVLGHKGYDFDKFPVLTGTSSFDGSLGTTPESLAEALLWKLGKWNVYKKFVENFNDKELKVSANGGVVFSAFAKHLQDKVNPIYDQHAIRALWAICEFSKEEEAKCKSLLCDGSGNWKDAGSGDDGSCYELFTEYMNIICNNNKINNEKIDQLLMPLGQAIKKESRGKRGVKSNKADYERFYDLCWSRL